MYTSAGHLSLKQNGVFTFVITSGCTDQHTEHISHNEDDTMMDGRRLKGEVVLVDKDCKETVEHVPVPKREHMTREELEVLDSQ